MSACCEDIKYEKGEYNLEYLEKLDKFLKLHRHCIDEDGDKGYTDFLFSEIVIQDLNLPCVLSFHYFINNDIDNMVESLYNEQKEMKDEAFDFE